MFCVNCGNKIEEGAKFCGKCGTKVEEEIVQKVAQMTEEQTESEVQSSASVTSNGKDNKPKIIIAVAAILVLVLVIFLIMPKNNDSSTGTDKNDNDKNVSQEQEDEGTYQECLEEFLQDEILNQMGMLDASERMVSYTYSQATNVSDAEGIAAYQILDLDRDEELELLVVYAQYGSYYADVYEVYNDEKVDFAANVELGDMGWSVSDGLDDISLIYTDSDVYLMYIAYESAIIADGYQGDLAFWSYDGDEFVPELRIETSAGSAEFVCDAYHYNADGSIAERNVIYSEIEYGEYSYVSDEDGSLLASQFDRYGIDVKLGYSMFWGFEEMFEDSVNREVLYALDRWGYHDYKASENTASVFMYYNDSNEEYNKKAVAYTNQLKEALANNANYTYGTSYCYYDMDKDGVEELIINTDGSMYYDIYKVSGAYAYHLHRETNGAGTQHQFYLTENGYCFVYHSSFFGGATYAAYYYVLDGYGFKEVACREDEFTADGETTEYKIRKDGEYVTVSEAEFNAVAGEYVNDEKWYDLRTLSDIVLPDGSKGAETGSTVTFEGDYILPTSSTAYLTMNDLMGLTAEQCRLARNEIYARHGRIFLAEDLKTYFESKSWYVGIIHPDNFTEDMLNAYEVYNRDLIIQYENERGYNK